jgi:hypothetical protein
MNQFEIKPLKTFIINDQLFNCSHCGSRTEELANLYHTNAKCGIEKCLNKNCNFICYEEEDEYFLKLWGVI